MLKPNDKIAIWMEASIDDDFGKMGISALRYLNNDIVCVIDSVYKGKKISDVSIIKKDIPIVDCLKDARELGANVILLGVLTSGGIRPKSWDPFIKESLEKRMYKDIDKFKNINSIKEKSKIEFPRDCKIILSQMLKLSGTTIKTFDFSEIVKFLLNLIFFEIFFFIFIF